MVCALKSLILGVLPNLLNITQILSILGGLGIVAWIVPACRIDAHKKQGSSVGITNL